MLRYDGLQILIAREERREDFHEQEDPKRGARSVVSVIMTQKCNPDDGVERWTGSILSFVDIIHT